MPISARSPPHSSFAPSLLPASTYDSTVSICSFETIAPRRVFGWSGSAATILPARSTTFDISSSCADSSTSRREPAAHTSPLP